MPTLRQFGASRRGGEKPRGRNETGILADAGRRRPTSVGRREWTNAAELGGGDLEEAGERDLRCASPWHHLRVMRWAGSGSQASTVETASKGVRWSRRDGNITTGRVHEWQAICEDGGITVSSWEASVDLAMCGKASNARSVTAKAQEEAGKANDSLPRTWRG
jgi:hypothetical protein